MVLLALAPPTRTVRLAAEGERLKLGTVSAHAEVTMVATRQAARIDRNEVRMFEKIALLLLDDEDMVLFFSPFS